MTSGSATDEPSCSEIVATTTKMPSADEHAAVAQRDVGRVADVDAVDEDHPRRARACRSARRLPSSSSGRPFSPLKIVVGVDADRLGELRRAGGCACSRRGTASRSAAASRLSISLSSSCVAVAGGVDRRVARRDHVAADVVEAVDRLVDGALVARDRRGARRRPCRPRAARPAGGRGGPCAAARSAARPGTRSR